MNWLQGADGIDHFNITGPTIENLTYSTEYLEDGTTILHGYSAVDNSEIFSLTVRPDGTYTYELLNPDATSSQEIVTSNLPPGNENWTETVGGEIEFIAGKTNLDGTNQYLPINSNSNGFGVQKRLCRGRRIFHHGVP